MNFKTIILSLLLIMGLMIISCEKEKTKDPEPTCTDSIKNGNEEDVDCGGDCDPCTTECETTSYNGEVKMIINKSCNVTGCHDGSNARKPFTNYTEVFGAANFINTRALDKKDMPPAGPLSAADMETIKCWLDNGKKEN